MPLVHEVNRSWHWRSGAVQVKPCPTEVAALAKGFAMRIVDVCEITKPIASPIRNAYIDFSKMTASLVAVVTDVVRDGRRVVGYGFNSNGRYGQGGLIRERFAPRILEAEHKLYPAALRKVLW